EIALRKLAQRGNWRTVPDSYLTLREGSPMRRLNLLGSPFVRLLCALPDRFTVPVEFVPPTFSALIDSHHLPPFCAGFLPLSVGRPPNLAHSLSCQSECFLARVLPPIAPVLRKYSITSSGMRSLLMERL